MKNPDVNTTALLRLADKLVGEGAYKDVGPVPEDNFDMGKWKCGTVACACGHAGSDPWFNTRGFSLSLDLDDPEQLLPTFSKWDSDREEYVTLSDWDAVKAFFKIDEDASENLFSWSPRVFTREQVAANIREFVKRWTDVKARELIDRMWTDYEF